jgi:hypothetical protein
MEMPAEKVILVLLAAVGIGLVAVIAALAGIILVSIVPRKAKWILRFRKGRQGSLKSSSDPRGLVGEGPARP